MPFVMHPRVRKGLCRLASLTAVGVLASTGVAAANPGWGPNPGGGPGAANAGPAANAAPAPSPSASSTTLCPAQPESTPFAQFGDTHSYFLIPGSDFAAATLPAGWTASNASLTPGAEPFNVGSSSTQSLTIQGGGSVTTSYICVDSTMPDLRFFARQAQAGSDLKVTLLVQLGYGQPMSIPLADLADGSMPSWAPTAALSANGLSVPAGTTVQAALQFQVPQSAGAWTIDGVYVDPYRMG